MLPGWSQGVSQAPPRVKSTRKRCQNGDQFNEKVMFFEVQLKAKCYRMLSLRLARLGGKTYGGCLPDVSQMPPRCFLDASQMSLRCFPESSRCLLSVFQMPFRCLSDVSQTSYTPIQESVWGLALGSFCQTLKKINKFYTFRVDVLR